MQYNQIFTAKKAPRYKALPLIIKSCVFVVVAVYIGYIVQKKESFSLEFQQAVYDAFSGYNYLLLLPLVLFFLNWALEAWKWKYLGSRIENMSFGKAFRGVLTGVALGLATPLGLGDYAGRILQLDNPDRSEAIGAVLVSRVSQFYITLLLGSISLLWFCGKDTDPYLNLVLIFFTVSANLFLIIVLLLHQRILTVVKDIPGLKRIYPYFKIIADYSLKDLSYILVISLIRYMVFAFQFVFILYVFGISNDLFLLTMGVNFIFLAKSIIPTFFDLGVRESAAVYFFAAAGIASEKIIVASLSLWAINILLPALIGLILIFRLKIFTDN